MKCIVAWVCVFSAMLLVGAQAKADEANLDATEYEFSDENIIGELPGMNGVSITVRSTGKDRSLIRIKTHFVREMLKSVETM